MLHGADGAYIPVATHRLVHTVNSEAGPGVLDENQLDQNVWHVEVFRDGSWRLDASIDFHSSPQSLLISTGLQLESMRVRAVYI